MPQSPDNELPENSKRNLDEKLDQAIGETSRPAIRCPLPSRRVARSIMMITGKLLPMSLRTTRPSPLSGEPRKQFASQWAASRTLRRTPTSRASAMCGKLELAIRRRSVTIVKEAERSGLT